MGRDGGKEWEEKGCGFKGGIESWSCWKGREILKWRFCRSAVACVLCICVEIELGRKEEGAGGEEGRNLYIEYLSTSTTQHNTKHMTVIECEL